MIAILMNLLKFVLWPMICLVLVNRAWKKYEFPVGGWKVSSIVGWLCCRVLLYPFWFCVQWFICYLGSGKVLHYNCECAFSPFSLIRFCFLPCQALSLGVYTFKITFSWWIDLLPFWNVPLDSSNFTCCEVYFIWY